MKPLAVADDEVLFQSGNIVSIALEEDDPHKIVIGLIDCTNYFLQKQKQPNF